MLRLSPASREKTLVPTSCVLNRYMPCGPKKRKIGWNVKVTLLKASHECLHFLLISLAFCSWHFPLGFKKKSNAFLWIRMNHQLISMFTKSSSKVIGVCLDGSHSKDFVSCGNHYVVRCEFFFVTFTVKDVNWLLSPLHNTFIHFMTPCFWVGEKRKLHILSQAKKDRDSSQKTYS